MIVEAIWDLLRSAVETVIGWLPDIAPPDLSGMVDAVAPLWGYFGWANKYVPLVEVAAMLALLVAAYAVMFTFKLTVWVLTKAHILGGE